MELISREEAVKKLGDDHFKNYGNAIMIILDLPTIEERIESEWINDIRYSGWTCKHCNYHDGNRTDKYCPNCGAKMYEDDKDIYVPNKGE